MPKTITSPVDIWPGTVTLYEPMTLVQEAAWEDAFANVREAKSRASRTLAVLPGIFACVQSWNLDGIPVQPTVTTFPNKPRLKSAELVAWLINEITALYQEGEDIPNA